MDSPVESPGRSAPCNGPRTASLALATQANAAQHRHLQHSGINHHRTDVHLLPALCPQNAARVGTPLVGQCHHRRAHRAAHFTFPALAGDEKEPLAGVPRSVDGKQTQPPTTHLHCAGAHRHCCSIHLLYLQLPFALRQCGNHHAGIGGSDIDDILPQSETPEHQA